MSGRSPSWRLQPSASAPSLPRSKRAGARPSESHFNPTLIPLYPTFRPTLRPESHEIPPNPAGIGVQVFSAPCPGIIPLPGRCSGRVAGRSLLRNAVDRMTPLVRPLQFSQVGKGASVLIEKFA